MNDFFQFIKKQVVMLRVPESLIVYEIIDRKNRYTLFISIISYSYNLFKFNSLYFLNFMTCS